MTTRPAPTLDDMRTWQRGVVADCIDNECCHASLSANTVWLRGKQCTASLGNNQRPEVCTSGDRFTALAASAHCWALRWQLAALQYYNMGQPHDQPGLSRRWKRPQNTKRLASPVHNAMVSDSFGP